VLLKNKKPRITGFLTAPYFMLSLFINPLRGYVCERAALKMLIWSGALRQEKYNQQVVLVLKKEL
jgi:xanthine/uracil/vitamin C permease (AzgA family)